MKFSTITSESNYLDCELKRITSSAFLQFCNEQTNNVHERENFIPHAFDSGRFLEIPLTHNSLHFECTYILDRSLLLLELEGFLKHFLNMADSEEDQPLIVRKVCYFTKSFYGI